MPKLFEIAKAMNYLTDQQVRKISKVFGVEELHDIQTLAFAANIRGRLQPVQLVLLKKENGWKMYLFELTESYSYLWEALLAAHA